MALARTLMIQGTGSDVGKSLIVAALCAYYRTRGVSVAPFKSQNMALNAAVTLEGHEVGRAQATQAAAAGLPVHVDMNPILLKPEGAEGCQVVAQGRVWGRLAAGEYRRRKPEFAALIEASLHRLRQQHELVIIEGAGSPAEVNLRDGEIVNMFVAALAEAPVWLVGDIDRGGVFASLLGTLMWLQPDERARVTGLLINKFRGDLELLRPGLPLLEARTQVPVLGVLPHLPDLQLPDEDSLPLSNRTGGSVRPGTLDVCVLRYPSISNFDDVMPLEHEPSATVRFVERADAVAHADLVILPGSKCTRADLRWLRQRGIAEALSRRAQQGKPILGFCGGYQMLGQRIEDPLGIEGDAGDVDGLGLLPVITRFSAEKTTAQVDVRLAPSLRECLGDEASYRGYEIHMGQPSRAPSAAPLLELDSNRSEGCLDADTRVAGTLVHGLLEHNKIRHALLRGLWQLRDGGVPNAETFPRNTYRPQVEFDRLATWIESALGARTLKAAIDQR